LKVDPPIDRTEKRQNNGGVVNKHLLVKIQEN
jgi:hypothetical protein